MNWFTGIVVFLLTWWTILFAVLPWGHRPHDGSIEEGIRAAPKTPDLKKKFIITTLVSLVLWLIIYILVDVEIISFREMAKDME